MKAMEELGVGRPSTYASVISTIVDRGYVWKKGSALVPSFTAFAVVGLLEQHFGELVDYGFTAVDGERPRRDRRRARGGAAVADPLLLRRPPKSAYQRLERLQRLARVQRCERLAGVERQGQRKPHDAEPSSSAATPCGSG